MNSTHRRITAGLTAGLAVAAVSASLVTPAVARSSQTDRHLRNPHTPALVQGTRVWTEDIAPLTTLNGVPVVGSGYGSSLVAKPGSTTTFYGLTDRGPNVDAPDGSKVLPVVSFQPAIGEFKLVNGRARLVRRIPLSGPQGQPYNGLVNTQANTGETMADLDGTKLPTSEWGYDPEGLVALRDGSFWVSDEYGPFITHFDRHGRQLERLSPFNGSLPGELAERNANKGMEGLTITPDGRTLVGMMQAALDAPDGAKSKQVSALRIVTIDLSSGGTHEYVYVLHNDKGANTTVSEIAALNSHEFLVDERDSAYEPGANKKLFRITLDGATDVGPASTVAASSYDAAKGGLLVGGRTVEAIAGTGNSTATTAALTAAGITPVTSSLFLDVAGLLTSIDPTGGYFGHDKIEGVAVLDGGRRIVLSNDSDFGLDGISNGTPRYQVKAKVLPNGQQDAGELLDITMRQVPAQFR